MKKRNLKAISVLLVFVFTALVAINAYAFSLIKTENTEVDTLQSGAYNLPQDCGEYHQHNLISTADAEDKTVEQEIYEGLLNCEATINIYSYRVPVSDFTGIYTKIINDNPDLFYVSSTVSYNYVSSNNCVYSIRPYYAMSQSEIDSARLIFNSGVQKALERVDSSMTDLQKALVLHDYICDNAEYPVILSESDDLDIYHSAYGFFYDGKVVCAGYSLVYSYLLNMCGIECQYVVSNAMQHAWNAVMIDNNWYNVDVTFDDIGVYNNQANMRGAMYHRCFVKSDDSIQGDMGFYHYGGQTQMEIDKSSTIYDNYFWNSVDTNIPVIDGYYYYLTPSANQYLYKRDINGSITRVGSSSFASISMTISGTYSDENNESHSISFKDYLNRLVYMDNRFYINSSYAVYSYSLMDNTYKKSTIVEGLSSIPAGLGDVGNELVYQTTDSADEIRFDKLTFWYNNFSYALNDGYNNYADINLDGYVNGKDYVLITR